MKNMYESMSSRTIRLHGYCVIEYIFRIIRISIELFKHVNRFLSVVLKPNRRDTSLRGNAREEQYLKKNTFLPFESRFKSHFFLFFFTQTKSFQVYYLKIIEML